MAVASSGVFGDGNRTFFGIDSTSGNIAPADGQDAVYSFGGSTTNRILANQLLPAGVAMIQTVVGAEKNTFTTRVAIQGTLVNLTGRYPTAPTNGTFPAGFLNVLGRTIRITGGGTTGTTGTPAFTYDIGLGAGVLATTGSQVRIAATTPQNFWFQAISTCVATGATGTMTTHGTFVLNSTALVGALWQFANSTVGTGLTADLTAALAISFNATTDASSSSNRVQLNALVVEVLA